MHPVYGVHILLVGVVYPVHSSVCAWTSACMHVLCVQWNPFTFGEHSLARLLYSYWVSFVEGFVNKL